MSVFYLESSALFKRYRTEKGTDVVNTIFAGRTQADIFVTSRLTTLEMESAAARGLKSRTITRQAHGAMVRAFADDLGNIVVLPLNGRIISEGEQAARKYSLRALDALHFSTALLVRQTSPAGTVLVTADHEVADAGRTAGFHVLNPEDQNAMQELARFLG